MANLSVRDLLLRFVSSAGVLTINDAAEIIKTHTGKLVFNCFGFYSYLSYISCFYFITLQS